MAWLIVSFVVVGAASWLALQSLGGGRNALAAWTEWLLLALWLVVASGIAAAALGQFRAGGLLALQFIGLVAAIAGRRNRLRDDLAALGALPPATLAALGNDRRARVGAAVLGLFFLLTAVLALLAEPVVYDALTYRLSRIGHWLNEGRIGSMVTNDPRQNYMPVAPDVVMAWLVSGMESGWRPAALAQWLGGVLLVLATIGLARTHGLGRGAAIASALLCVSLANVAPQFTTVHTDLFTAGVLAAGWYRWQSSFAAGRASPVAGLAAGLALASKGTVLYLAPTILGWLLWMQFRHRARWPAWRATLVAFAVSGVVLAAPGFWRNVRDYGGLFGPPEFVAMHHQPAAGLGAKTWLNLRTSFAQNLEPHAQPPGLRGAAVAAGTSLAATLPEKDPHAYEALNRRETVEALLARPTPDADATALGIIVPLLFAGGALAALFRKAAPGRADFAVAAAGVAVFMIFFHAMQQWHPYGFRYFVLVVPWMALVAGWFLESLPRILRAAGWTIALASGLFVAAHVLTESHQAGWPAAARPEASRGYFVAQGWGAWSDELVRERKVLHLALPFNRPLAAFYQRGDARELRPMPEAALTAPTAAEQLQALGDGWLVVPVARFIGREGNTVGRTWLFEGDPNSPFSVAAYRSAHPGECTAMIYAHQVARASGHERHQLLIRAGSDGRASLRVIADGASQLDIATPLRQWREDARGGEHTLRFELPAGQVAEVVVTIRPVEASGPGGAARLEFVP